MSLRCPLCISVQLVLAEALKQALFSEGFLQLSSSVLPLAPFPQTKEVKLFMKGPLVFSVNAENQSICDRFHGVHLPIHLCTAGLVQPPSEAGSSKQQCRVFQTPVLVVRNKSWRSLTFHEFVRECWLIISKCTHTESQCMMDLMLL